MRRAPWFAVLCSVFSLSACSDDPGFEPYSGAPAYPNRRASFDAFDTGLALVTNSLSDSISVLDLDAMQVVATIPVGRDPVDIDGPHHLAVDRERGLIYVALSYPPLGTSGPHAAHGASTRPGYVQLLSLSDLRPLAELRVEQNPGDIALSSSGQLAVSHYDQVRARQGTSLEEQRAALILVDPAAGLFDETARTRRISLCITPHAIAFDPNRPRAYVSCSGEDSVALVDSDAASVLARVPVADPVGAPGSPEHEPYALTLNDAGDTLLVSNTASRTVVLLSTADAPERLATAALLGAPYFAAWLGAERAIVPLQAPNGVAVIDARTAELLADTTYAADQCENPHEARVARDGRVFLVCEGDHTAPGAIVRIDPDSLEVLQRVTVGVYPDRIVLLE